MSKIEHIALIDKNGQFIVSPSNLRLKVYNIDSMAEIDPENADPNTAL